MIYECRPSVFTSALNSWNHISINVPTLLEIILPIQFSSQFTRNQKPLLQDIVLQVGMLLS